MWIPVAYEVRGRLDHPKIMGILYLRQLGSQANSNAEVIASYILRMDAPALPIELTGLLISE